MKAPGAINVGKAAHITAASPGGPRYDSTLTPQQRRAADNGIWLCAIHADIVDKDATGYSTEVLRKWKADAESEARLLIGKAKVRAATPSDRERQIKRDLKLRNTMWADLVKPYDPNVPRKPFTRPYEKFKYTKLIVRSLEDTTYGKDVDDAARHDFQWFRVEPYDFYHGGLVVILNLSGGIMDERGRWDVVSDNETFDPGIFHQVRIWVLGEIPWRNIRHYDPRGDEYYNEPHLYCSSEDDGWPYEARAYALLGELYDSYLDPKRRLKGQS